MTASRSHFGVDQSIFRRKAQGGKGPVPLRAAVGAGRLPAGWPPEPYRHAPCLSLRHLNELSPLFEYIAAKVCSPRDNEYRVPLKNSFVELIKHSFLAFISELS